MNPTHSKGERDTTLSQRPIPLYGKRLATKFAIWFVVNWEWYEDTDKNEKYRSIYDGKTILTISEIYDRWLLNDV